MLGEPDTAPTPDSCDLFAFPGYVALGGDGGFVVVSFGATELTRGTVSVLEINADTCEGATAERPDTYEVWFTTDARNARSVRRAAEIRDEWCLVGRKGGTGGSFSGAIDITECDR